jgi:hypothetical protein
MKFLIVQFFQPPPATLSLLDPNYSPQHPVLKHPLSMFLP